MYRLFVCGLWIALIVLAACSPTEQAATPTTPPTQPEATEEVTSVFQTRVIPPPPQSLPPGIRWTLTPTPPNTDVAPVLPDEPIPSPTPPCDFAPRTRMIVRERGQVMAEDPRPLNVRSGPSTEFRILGRLEVLDVFLVLDGPRCGGEYVWYLIRRGDLEGWIAEGDFGKYYIEPYFPG